MGIVKENLLEWMEDNIASASKKKLVPCSDHRWRALNIRLVIAIDVILQSFEIAKTIFQ